MKVGFIGIGNMGISVMCAALSKGIHAIAIDLDTQKIQQLLEGKTIVPEVNSEEIIKKALLEKRLEATTDISAIKKCDMSFIGVQTPVIDTKCDYSTLERVIVDICRYAPLNYTVFCGSTVFPGSIKEHVLNILTCNNRQDINFVYQPVFLRAGFGIADYLNPGKIIIGVKDQKSPPKLILEFLHSVINCPEDIKIASYYEAEWIKMVHNQFMCTKITFVNEIGLLCKDHGVNAGTVIDMAFDENKNGRLLTKSHMKPGIPFSGPCLPKDVSYMNGLVHNSWYSSQLTGGVLNSAEISNNSYKKMLIDEVMNAAKKGVVGIIGVSFRSDFNEIRHSIALDFIKEAHNQGIPLIGYDKFFEDISEEQFKLACRGDAYIESLYYQIRYTFDEVINKSTVLFINCTLSDTQKMKIKEKNKTIVDIYNNYEDNK